MKKIINILVMFVMIALAQGTRAQDTIELQSLGAMEFGSDGVLFVGDSYGSQVVAIETNDTLPADNPQSPIYVESLDIQLAAMIGTQPSEIFFNDMVVNPISQNVYLSVHIGRSIDPDIALVRYVKNTGQLEILDLADYTLTAVHIPDAPAFEDILQYGQSQRMFTITDLTYYEGELLIAGVSNQDFASTLRRVSYPFTDDMSVATIEIYHASHNAQETHAPIVTSLVYEIDGEPYLIAAYTCTPLVKIPLTALQDGEHVVGTTIAELGFGNAPVDMLIYNLPAQFGGGQRLLITNDQRNAISVGTQLFADAPPLTDIARSPVGLDQMQLPLSGALQTASLNQQFALTIRYNVQTRDLSLMSLQMGTFFEVSEMVVESNWPQIEDSQTQSTNSIDYSLEG